jgi:hypothetical protein
MRAKKDQLYHLGGNVPPHLGHKFCNGDDSGDTPAASGNYDSNFWLVLENHNSTLYVRTSDPALLPSFSTVGLPKISNLERRIQQASLHVGCSNHDPDVECRHLRSERVVDY